MENTLCLYCECKRFLSWTRNYICMVKPNALYLLPKPRGMRPNRQGDQLVLDLDEKTILSSPRLQTYRAENVTDYRCYTSYDERQPDLIPLEDVQKYATLSFREKQSGRQITLRCVCGLEELRAMTDQIFKPEEKEVS